MTKSILKYRPIQHLALGGTTLGMMEARSDGEWVMLRDLPKWLPIDTAPLNEYVLLCLEGKDWAIGCWNPHVTTNVGAGAWVNDDGTEWTPFDLTPSHWMPLPQLPDGLA